MRPLYQEAAEARLEDGGNTGLWYDKFCDRWKDDFSGLGDEGKKSWITEVTGNKCGDERLLQRTKERMARLLESADGELLFYKLESDFVTGLGRQHPVENGFAWHPTLGTPYLPGSSVKGVVRAWAAQWDGADEATLKRIFGSESKKVENFQAGSVVFLDAIPSAPVRLKADIMTPHYGPYYQDDTGRTPPADWHSPNPIPFLAVEAGASFVFGVLPRCKEHVADCQKVRAWLEEALEWTGAGAKTAVGYGRFAQDVSAQQKFEKEEEARLEEQRARQEEEQRRQEIEALTAGKSELYRELYEASVKENWREDREAFVREGVIEGWLERLEADPQPDATGYLRELVELHFKGLLQNPEARKGKKQRPVYSQRQRNLARRMLRLPEGTE
ncbi:MAG: type III-B CRISPR module RAMP protein Cmr6 [Actinomycetota bacterium]